MKTRRDLLAWSVSAALAAGLLAGCGGDDEGDETTPSPSVTQESTAGSGEQSGSGTTTTPAGTGGEGGTKTTSDVDAATAVVAGVVDRDLTDDKYGAFDYKNDNSITQGMKDKIAELGKQGQNFDPFICSQELPKGEPSYQPGKQAGNEMTIIGNFKYGGGAKVGVTYAMKKEGEQWKLDTTDCIERSIPQ